MIVDFIRKKNMLFKLILSYVLVGFLFIGGFSYVVLSKVSENMTAETIETSERMIDQSYNIADMLLNSTYNYYSKLFTKNEQSIALCNGTEFTRYDTYRINGALNDFAQTKSACFVYICL